MTQLGVGLRDTEQPGDYFSPSFHEVTSDGDTARTELLRPAVYRWGLTFSVAITLLPAAFVPMFWFMHGARAVL